MTSWRGDMHGRADPGIQLLNVVGGRAEALVERLPEPVRGRLEAGTVQALEMAMAAAHRSRGMVAGSLAG